MQAIIFIGLQATGKTTFYKTKFIDSHLRISLDLLRTRHREKRILECCIDSMTDFVVDNTNPLREDRARYIGPAKLAGYEIVGYYFAPDLQRSLARNQARDAPAVVPRAGVLSTYNKLELPSYSEGFDRLCYVGITQDGGFRVEDWKDEVH